VTTSDPQLLAPSTADAAGDVEPAVESSPEPRVPGLSPSRANDYQQCPLLFRFRVVDRLPEPPSSAAARGTLVHSVLERLYDLPLGERTPAAAHALVPEAWERLLERSPEVTALFASEEEREAWLGTARLLLDTYFTLEDPNRLQPGERELSVRTQLEDGPQLRGIVDRLDVAPDGAMRVVDYKTGKSPNPGYEGSALFQMRFYSYVLWRERGVLPRMLQLVYLGNGQVLRHQPSEEEMRTLELRLRSLWESIEESARTGQWRPRRSRLCDWCAHRAICPEFGGTPPQIPEGAVERAIGVTPEALAS
jgi:putative RecB family exonuclease